MCAHLSNIANIDANPKITAPKAEQIVRRSREVKLTDSKAMLVITAWRHKATTSPGELGSQLMSIDKLLLNDALFAAFLRSGPHER